MKRRWATAQQRQSELQLRQIERQEAPQRDHAAGRQGRRVADELRQLLPPGTIGRVDLTVQTLPRGWRVRLGAWPDW